MLSLCALVALLFLPVQLLQAESTEIATQRMLSDVKKLASDEWEGRGVGTNGLKQAAEFIADSFRTSGLDVTVAGGDPFQEFEIIDGAKLGEPNSLKFIGPQGEELNLELGTEFQVCSFGGSGQLEGELVFAGYGIIAEDLEYDEYQGIDVKDKIVILMRRNPHQSDPNGAFAVGHGISRHAALTTKLSRAFSRGAKAVIFVNDPHTGREEKEELEQKVAEARDALAKAQKDPQQKEQLKEAQVHLEQVEEILAAYDSDPLMKFGYGGTRSGTSPPTFHMKQEVCNEILTSALGTSLEEIETQIDRMGVPLSKALPGWKVSAQASLNIIRVPVRNVIGVLEGEGPRREETIVIGAHFDHLGRGGEGSLAPQSREIHNGADDNASGTTGLLELARRLGARETPLPRRIVFIAFNGEERGLLGANEYVDKPLYPLENTVAMLNMDMIGRLTENKLTVFGTGTSSVWDALIDQAVQGTELELSKKTEGFGPSDHAAFYGKKVPVLHFFTGIHDDYHRPGDDWEKLNVAGMATIVNVLEHVATSVASAETRPDYVHIAGSATLARSGSRPYFGSIPDFGKEAQGYAISGVSPGSPAEKGGLRGGDVIIELGGRKTGGLDDFDLALRDFGPGEQVDVVVLRGTEKVSLKVTLGTPKN